MNEYANDIDMALEKEEYISAEEYLRRREAGEITPADVRIVPADIRTRSFGGFVVKLKTPRYKVSLKNKPEAVYGW